MTKSLTQKKKKTKSKKKTGPTPMKLDWDQVKALCALQCTKDEIAGFFGISEDSIKRAAKRDFGVRFGDLRVIWSAGGKCSLRRKQWKLADTSAAMAIFLGKQILHQRDDINLNHNGSVIQEIIHYGDEPPKRYEDEPKEIEAVFETT